MANINEILARAAALRDETALNSISPERAGGIMYDTLLALNELWLQQGAALVISKIYASVAAMEADTAPVSDLTGKPLRPGQIVVIASSDSDNGSVYRYNGTESPSWTLVGSIGNLEPVDNLDSDSTTLPLAAHQGKVLDSKISQLGQYIEPTIFNLSANNYPRVGSFKVGDTIRLKLVSMSGQTLTALALVPIAGFTQNLNPPCSVRNIGEEIIYTFEQDYDDVYIGIYDGTAVAEFARVMPDIGDLKRSISSLNTDVQYNKSELQKIDAFPFVTLIDGGIIGLNDEIISHPNFGHTDYIEVPRWANKFSFNNTVTIGNVQYSLSDYEFATYDGSKTFIETIHGNTEKAIINVDIDSSVVRYIRLNYGLYEKTNHLCVAYFWRESNHILKDKTINILGDSITYQGTFIPSLQKKGCIINNYGVSGTTISSEFSNSFVSRYASMTDNCDIVIVFGGINDWQKGGVLGTFEDTNGNTFYSSLHTLIGGLKEKYINGAIQKPIFVCTPLHSQFSLSGYEDKNEYSITDGIISANTYGNGAKLIDYVDAIRKVCEFYAVPVIDLYALSFLAPIQSNNKSKYYQDGLHPKSAGGELIANCMLNLIGNYIRNM